MLGRAKLGVVTLVVGVTSVTMSMALVPATMASATVAKSNLCKAYSAEEKQQIKGSAALGKEMKSGKWSSIQKALLATFNHEAAAEKQFATLLSGASAKVKTAVAVALQLDDTFRSIIEHSTSLPQFQTAITAAESTPKVSAAEKVLVNYTRRLCPA